MVSGQTALTYNGQRITVEQWLQLSTEKEQQGDFREASRYLNEVATGYWEIKNYPKAIEYFEKSLKLNERIDNQQGMLGIYSNLGFIYADLREYEKAYQYLQKTLEGRRKGTDKYATISALINNAVVLNSLKRYSESIIHLEEALDRAREISDQEEMRKCYGMLAETHEKAGHPKEMLHYFELYKTFHEKSQREKVSVANAKAEEAGLKAKELALENERKQIEIIRKELALKQKEEAMRMLEFEKDSAFANATKAQLYAQKLELEKEVAAGEYERAKMQTETQARQNRLYTIVSIALFGFTLVVAVLLGLLYRQKQVAYHQVKTHDEAITQKNAQLESLNDIKTKIFSIISHDLRTPLTSLQGAVQLLEMEVLTAEEFAKMRAEVGRQTQNVLELLDNLLIWSKSQMQGMEVHPKIFDLAELAQRNHQLVLPQYNAKKVQLRNQVNSPTQVLADPEMISLAIRNLLANALKFTPNGRIVEISLQIRGTYACLAVMDQGVGIAPEDQSKLFGLRTFSKAGTNNEKGSGLGLLLCKDFVERNGGNIWVESTPGKGSTFFFTVPLATTQKTLNGSSLSTEATAIASA